MIAECTVEVFAVARILDLFLGNYASRLKTLAARSVE
jgi:hypothetical protein